MMANYIGCSPTQSLRIGKPLIADAREDRLRLKRVDLSQIARDMKEKLEANPNKVIESLALSKLQAEELRDYFVNYNIIGIDSANPNVLGCSTYVLCVTSGGGQRA